MNVIEMHNEGNTRSHFEQEVPGGAKAAAKHYDHVVVWAPTGQVDANGNELYVNEQGASRVIPVGIVNPSTYAAAAAMGRKGGAAKSEAKTAASRANGARGGRPKKKTE